MHPKYKVVEMYHTHPKNSYLSLDDPFQGIIPTYAIGWDGVKRGAAPRYKDSFLLDEIIIIAPATKK